MTQDSQTTSAPIPIPIPIRDPAPLLRPTPEDWLQARHELNRAAMVRRFNGLDRAPAEPIERVLEAIDSFLGLPTDPDPDDPDPDSQDS